MTKNHFCYTRTFDVIFSTQIRPLIVKLKQGHRKKRFTKKQLVPAIQNFFDKHPSLVKVTKLKDIGDLESSLLDFLEKHPVTTKKEILPEKVVTQVVDSNETPKEVEDSPEHRMNSNGTYEEPKNPWTLIEKFQILERKEAEGKRKQMSELRKKKMAKALNDQINLKEKAAKLEQDKEDNDFQRQQNEIFKKWEEEQRLTTAREKEKIAQLKKARQDQIIDNAARKKKQLALTRAEDLKEIQQISKALKEEENEKVEKKKKERQKWEIIKVENAKKVEKRRLMKKEEERIDAQLMAEYTAKMDREEAKRIEAIEDRAKKLEANRKSLKHEPDQLLADGMTSVERSMNKTIIEDARAFLAGRCV